MQKKKKFKFSIFLKLIVLLLVFIVLVNLSLAFIIRFSFEKDPRDLFHKPLQVFRQFVTKELGNPPDSSKAREITKEFFLNMRFDVEGLQWTNEESVPTISELQNHGEFRNDRLDLPVHFKGRPYFISKVLNGYVIFSLNLPRDYVNKEKAIIAIIITVCLLAGLLYFSLRWIFGPIKKLSDAVEQISEGNFEVNVDVKRKDELGNLADSINAMKKNIFNMIKAKESLLVDVSHELRSPLTRIKLANEFVDDEKIRSKIRDDVKEMEVMITELLETYRMENIHGKILREPTDIVKLIKETVSKFDSHTVLFNSEVSQKEVFLDRIKIETALRNIIDNAIKYSAGSTVEVNIYSVTEVMDEICISIIDKGKGIDEKEIKNIFEPFYRIDKSRDKKIKGYGLGLSLAKKILNEHNASIEVKSKLNKGTEFIIRLPARSNLN